MADTPNPPLDLTNCDREPIHIPGAVQEHGCLLVCDPGARHILRHSLNAAAFLGLESQDLVGRTLEETIGGTQTHELRNALARAALPSRAGLMPGVALSTGQLFDVSVHRHDGVALIEFERPGSQGPASPLEFARTLVGRLVRRQGSDQLVRDASRLLRAVLQYDRVMIYRFSEDGSGKVVSEAKRADLESFHGQHFPASDIPQQARRLYVLNPIRLVSDASGARVPIVPEFDGEGRALDMSYAHLRSVSPIHCEYLRNMGVSASMSISIIVGGELWGLIACHHYSPRALPMNQRIAAEIFGEFVSLQIEALLQSEKIAAAEKARRFFETVLAGGTQATDAWEFLGAHLPQLGQLIPCDGGGLWLGSRWTTHGAAPPPESALPLATLAAQAGRGRIWSTAELREHMGDAAMRGGIAGVLAVPLSQIGKDFLFFFRKEVLQTVVWGGDPNKTYQSGPMGDRLTPRKSFSIWKETVEGRAVAWTEVENQLAETARSLLIEIVLRQEELRAQEREQLEQRRRWLNQELSHRVKNIVALVRSIVAYGDTAVESAAVYAEALKGRLAALAFAHDQIIGGTEAGGDLGRLLAAELEPYRRAGTVSLDGPSLSLDGRSLSVMALVLHELATNAAKYGSLSRPGGRLGVAWERLEDGSGRIEWRETGGPTVSAPTREGFGSVLTRRSIPFDLGGTVELDYAPAGFSARFVLPARFLKWNGEVASTADAEPVSPAEIGSDLLAGRHVLIVEDQFLIALDLEDELRSFAAASADVVATVADAMATIAARKPDLAILDIDLGGETTEAIAERLAELGVPFLFATGYDTAPLAQRFGAGVVRKPVARENLQAALARAFAVT